MEEGGGGIGECVICMGGLFDQVDGNLQTPPEEETVITPCDHYFHQECLSTWMDQKLECPVCRNPIPPFPSPDDEEDLAW